jgi:FMN phosphatase YigB (HAD superfamily)
VRPDTPESMAPAQAPAGKSARQGPDTSHRSAPGLLFLGTRAAGDYQVLQSLGGGGRSFMALPRRVELTGDVPVVHQVLHRPQRVNDRSHNLTFQFPCAVPDRIRRMPGPHFQELRADPGTPLLDVIPRRLLSGRNGADARHAASRIDVLQQSNRIRHHRGILTAPPVFELPGPLTAQAKPGKPAGNSAPCEAAYHAADNHSPVHGLEIAHLRGTSTDPASDTQSTRPSALFRPGDLRTPRSHASHTPDHIWDVRPITSEIARRHRTATPGHLRQQERSHNGGTISLNTIDHLLGQKPVDPAAAATLRVLHDDLGLGLVLANTQPHETRWPDLQKAGIDDLFSVALHSYPLGVRKPDPVFYRLVLAAAGAPPDQVLFVGDNLACHVAGPVAHGMQAVLVRPNGLRPGEELPDGVPLISHFRELAALLETR